MALALADKTFDDKEREVYLTFLKQLALPEEEVLRLAEKVDADLDGVCAALGSIQEAANRESVARCFCLIVAAGWGPLGWSQGGRGDGLGWQAVPQGQISRCRGPTSGV